MLLGSEWLVNVSTPRQIAWPRPGALPGDCGFLHGGRRPGRLQLRGSRNDLIAPNTSKRRPTCVHCTGARAHVQCTHPRAQD